MKYHIDILMPIFITTHKKQCMIAFSNIPFFFHSLNHISILLRIIHINKHLLQNSKYITLREQSQVPFRLNFIQNYLLLKICILIKACDDHSCFATKQVVDYDFWRINLFT